MSIPESEKVRTVGELLKMVELQADSARKLAMHVASLGSDDGSLRPVLAAQIEVLCNNLDALRSALSGSDALDEPLGEILEFFAWKGKAAGKVLDNTASRITRIIDEEPADTPPEEEEQEGNNNAT